MADHSSPRFSVAFRLVWIDARLDHGPMNRADLMTAFRISTPQASKDVAEMLRRFPEALAYDRSAKSYLRGPGGPAFRAETRQAVLRAQQAVAGEDFPWPI